MKVWFQNRRTKYKRIKAEDNLNLEPGENGDVMMSPEMEDSDSDDIISIEQHMDASALSVTDESCDST